MSKRSQKPKRRKPLGEPLPEATEQEAEITPEDIERAKQWVAKYGSQTLKGMLEAKVKDEGGFE